MGAGRYSSAVFASTVGATKAAGGSTFAYSDTLMRRNRADWKAHENLDPNGVTVRESRDSVEHPNSTAIAVLFDVTGSMRTVPGILQDKLPLLLGQLEQKHLVPDPQILFGAIGDAYSDRVPLQVAQFESDNRMDEHLGNILLEGGGGGSNHESYELGLYFMAKHTSIDCQEVRGEKGYLFIVGDELPYDEVNPHHVRDILGSGTQLTHTFQEVLDECKQKYEVFFILPNHTFNADDPEIINFWTNAVGADNFIKLKDANDIADVIATEIGEREAVKSLRKIATP